MLLAVSLQEALARLLIKDYINFYGFPDTPAAVGERWVQAIHTSYAVALTPPLLPGLDQAAANVLHTAMAALTFNSPPTALAAAITQYSVALAAAIAPPFTGVPPAIPLNLQPVFTVGLAGSAEGVVTTMTTVLDSWFRTGTAVNQLTGVVVPWS